MKYLDLIKRALRGDENEDYTKLSINTSLVLLAVPMVIEMLFESLFAVVDAFFVAKYVGIDGIATVGLTEAVLTLIYSLAWGLSTAATAIIARKIGEKKNHEASQIFKQIINISLALGLIISIFGYFYSADILKLMGASSSVIRDGLIYTKIQFLSSPIIILLFAIGGALRGAGSASQAMKAMIIANLINIVMDYIFIPVMGMGVEGAAFATLIGRTSGVIIQFIGVTASSSVIKAKLNDWNFNLVQIKEILKLAAGGAGQFIIQSASWVFLTRILSQFGSEVVAGYTIAIRIIVFTILPSWGLANAAASLVGQNLGAGQPDRSASSAWRAGFMNMGFLGIVAIFFFIFATDIVGIFNTDPKVLETGVESLKILCAGYVFFGLGMVMSQAINGSGDTKTPTLFNLICFWAIEIPLAYLLAITLSFGPAGVFWSIVIAESILAVLAIIYFKRGKWKTNNLAI